MASAVELGGSLWETDAEEVVASVSAAVVAAEVDEALMPVEGSLRPLESPLPHEPKARRKEITRMIDKSFFKLSLPFSTLIAMWIIYS